MTTIFTKIINGDIPSYKIWEDAKFVAFLDIRPIRPGHTLVVPRQEVDEWQKIDDAVLAELMTACKHVAGMLKKATGAKRIGVAIEGFGVPHLHVHLVPVNTGNELNPSLARETSQEELQSMQKKIMDAQKENSSPPPVVPAK